MQYLRDKWSYFKNLFVTKVEEHKDRKVTKYDIYFEQVYKILSWEDNTYTLGVFILFNFLFWYVEMYCFRLKSNSFYFFYRVIVLFEIKPLGILFSNLLILFLWDTYFETRDYSAYHVQYREEMDDISNCFLEVWMNLISLKKESPSTVRFCNYLKLELFLCFISVLFWRIYILPLP